MTKVCTHSGKLLSNVHVDMIIKYVYYLTTFILFIKHGNLWLGEQ